MRTCTFVLVCDVDDHDNDTQKAKASDDDDMHAAVSIIFGLYICNRAGGSVLLLHIYLYIRSLSQESNNKPRLRYNRYISRYTKVLKVAVIHFSVGCDLISIVVWQHYLTKKVQCWLSTYCFSPF